MDERTRRIGENEVLFREVNERIDALSESFGVAGDTMQIVCECGDGSCLERVEVTPAQYAAVRAHGARFIAVPGHEKPSVETVVESHEGFNVLEKREGGPAELARDRDPR